MLCVSPRMIFRCHKSRTQYFQNGGEYFTDCAMRKGDYLDIYKRNSNCADYSDKCTSFWELLLSYAFSIFHLSVLRNTCIISLIVFLFFVFVFFPRTDLTIDKVSHFISHKKFLTLLAQVECIVLVTYDPSERPDASSFLSQALALLTRASVIWVTEKFFFFLPHPLIKSFLEPITRFSTFSPQRMPVLFQFIVILG